MGRYRKLEKIVARRLAYSGNVYGRRYVKIG